MMDYLFCDFHKKFAHNIITIEPLTVNAIMTDEKGKFEEKLKSSKNVILNQLSDNNLDTLVVTDYIKKDLMNLIFTDTNIGYFDIGGHLPTMIHNLKKQFGETVKFSHVGTVNTNYGSLVHKLLERFPDILQRCDTPKDFYSERMLGVDWILNEINEPKLFGEIGLSVNSLGKHYKFLFPGVCYNLPISLLKDNSDRIKNSDLILFSSSGLFKEEFGENSLKLLNGEIVNSEEMKFNSLLLTDKVSSISIKDKIKLSNLDLICGTSFDIESIESDLFKLSNKMKYSNGIVIDFSKDGLKIVQNDKVIIDRKYDFLIKDFLKQDKEKKDKLNWRLDDLIDHVPHHILNIRNSYFGILSLLFSNPKQYGNLSNNDIFEISNNSIWNYALKPNGKLYDNNGERFFLNYGPVESLFVSKSGFASDIKIIHQANKDIENLHSPVIGRIKFIGMEKLKMEGKSEFLKIIDYVTNELFTYRNELSEKFKIDKDKLILGDAQDIYLLYLSGTVENRNAFADDFKRKVNTKINDDFLAKYKKRYDSKLEVNFTTVRSYKDLIEFINYGKF